MGWVDPLAVQIGESFAVLVQFRSLSPGLIALLGPSRLFIDDSVADNLTRNPIES